MADKLDRLVAHLAKSGVVATREQAEALAIRVAGSVDTYLEDLEQTAAELEDYEPLESDPDQVPDKFKQPLV